MLDPGQRVLLLSEDGSRIEGFRAVSGPLTAETGGVILRVAIEEEYGDSMKRTAALSAWHGQPRWWRCLVPWYKWQRWFTR